MNKLRLFVLLGILLVATNGQATPQVKTGMQAMVNAYFVRQNVKPTIVKKDMANGYMKYKVMTSTNQLIQGELAYYVSSNGKEILAATAVMCMQACGTSLEFYAMHNGKLTLLPNQITGMDMEAFAGAVSAQIKARMSQNEKTRQANGEMALYNEIINLPQHGTTIYIKKDSRVDKNTVVVAELRFNLANGKFKFVKK